MAFAPSVCPGSMDKIPEYRHIKLIEGIINDTKGAVNLGKEIFVKVEGKKLIFQKILKKDIDYSKWKEDFKVNAVILKNDKKIRIKNPQKLAQIMQKSETLH